MMIGTACVVTDGLNPCRVFVTHNQVFHPDRLPQACATANREVAQQIFDRAQKMEQ